MRGWPSLEDDWLGELRRNDESYLDGKISVVTEDSYDMVAKLEKEEGILVGHSSAAAMVAALQLAQEIKKGVIVIVFPDSCDTCYINFGKFKESVEKNHIPPKIDS